MRRYTVAGYQVYPFMQRGFQFQIEAGKVEQAHALVEFKQQINVTWFAFTPRR